MTSTYVAVRDAAEAIVRAAERCDVHAGVVGTEGDRRSGKRWLIGDQRLSTKAFYALVAELSGQPAPTLEIPPWLAKASARVMTTLASYSGRPPMAPIDLVQTAESGTLCFDAAKSKRELGMQYTPIRSAFVEAIDFITDASIGVGGAGGLPQAVAASEERCRLVAGETGPDTR
eukprot:CAMPEP_0115829190 /NCGR_PEP_ID=MMETSP0287-20121206/969_1 /TAXON_ID=412157 /ORGANISM="Chrysochromulina rotalis, Strain UIO044" /LENGTH=173 /DNA_ID=CAMNT_0003282445 /DNA_START=306 /DNA_END=827 /DNA_ORIENTATION=-